MGLSDKSVDDMIQC